MKIVIDVDDTICVTDHMVSYRDREPKWGVIKRLREYKDMGYEIVLCTGRQMRTYEGNIGKINVFTIPVLIEWLRRYNVPFDEIHVGKPWEGHDGFRVDDKTVRPREFVELSVDEIKQCIQRDK